MRTKKEFIIYALHHDDSDSIYIGKSSHGLTRPRGHGCSYNMTKFSHYPVVRWIKKLRSQGKDYNITVLETCATHQELSDAERFHIAYMRSIGASLLNITDGGGYIGATHTLETKARLSALRKGRPLSEAHRKKIAEGVRPVMASQEYHDNMSRAKKGIPFEAAHKASMSISADKRSTPEYREAMSQKLKGCKRPPRAPFKQSHDIKKAIDSGVRSDVMVTWRKELGLSSRSTIKLLGVKRTAFQRFERGVMEKAKTPTMRINLLGDI